MSKRLPLISPGEILLEEFLRPSKLSQNQLARAIDVPAGRINDIIRGKRSITRDTAARLAVYWGTSVDLWINLQARYDAKVAQRDLIPIMERRIATHTSSA